MRCGLEWEGFVQRFGVGDRFGVFLRDVETHGVFKFLGDRVRFYSLDNKGFMWLHGADVFAGTTADANVVMNMGNVQVFFRLVRQHFNGGNGAVFAAGRAIRLISGNYTEFFAENCRTDLGLIFLFRGQGTQCSRRANQGTEVAVFQAKTVTEVHHRLHKSGEPPLGDGRFEHLIFTGTDAELASCTTGEKIFKGSGSRRRRQSLIGTITSNAVRGGIRQGDIRLTPVGRSR